MEPAAPVRCLDENGATNYLDGALSPEQIEQVQAHLDGCAPCQRLLAQLVTATAQTGDGAAPLMREELVPGELVGRYRTLRQLGAGAMGVVYLAHDPELDRSVALKLMRARAAVPGGEARLKREAMAMAQLAHKNVCSVFDVCSDERGDSIVMEFIDGLNLRAHLKSARPNWRAGLTLALEAGEGLAAAHARGIVHRDFKPDNVLVSSSGRVCVTDFGLAGSAREPSGETLAEGANASEPSRWRPSGGGNFLTRAGTRMGTPAYMAPEVYRGERATALSDQFSFALTAWECVHGDCPFSALALSELRSGERPSPRPVTGTPRRIRRALLRAMDPDPSRRFPSVPDLLAALHTPTASSQRTVWAIAVLALLLAAGVWLSRKAPAPTRVAVADLDNRTGDTSLDYLGDLFQTSLEQSRHLSIVPRERLRGLAQASTDGGDAPLTPERTSALARAEGAKLLILPSAWTVDSKYRVRVQVLDAASGETLFMLEEAASKDDLLVALGRLSDAVRERLRESSAQVRSARVEPGSALTRNLDVYKHYALAEQYWEAQQFKDALPELRRAVELDPDFAAAQYRLATVLIWENLPGPREALDRAAANLERLPVRERAHIVALRAQLAGDVDTALAGWNEVLERFPDDREALFWSADLHLHHQRDFELARERFLRVAQLYPRWGAAFEHAIQAQWVLGDNEGAIETSRQLLEVKRLRDQARSYYPLIVSLGRVGRFTEADAVVSSSPFVDGRAFALLRLEGLLYQRKIDEAFELVKSLTPLNPEDRDQAESRVLAASGRYREAVTLLERSAAAARARGDPNRLGSLGAFRSVLLKELGDAAGAREAASSALDHQARVSTRALWLMQYAADESGVDPGDFIARILPHTVEAVAMSEGRAWLRAGKTQEAAERFERLCRGSTGVVGIYACSQVMRVAATREDWALVIVAAKRIDSISPDDGSAQFGVRTALWPRALLGMAEAHVRLGQKDQAAAVAGRLVDAFAKGDQDLAILREARRLAGR